MADNGEIDIDLLLSKESSDLNKDKEIERILNTFRLDAYSVLDLQPGCTTKDIRLQYRKKSLLIHPDKTANKQAPDAFDRLKKAEDELQDEKKRAFLDQSFSDARRLLIQEKKWSIDDERLKGDEFLSEWRDKTRDILVENELRRRKLANIQMEEEGRQKRKAEEMAEEKKKNIEAKKSWEENRDMRVGKWREYQKVISKKKRKKTDILG
ncbi:DnaJ-domain-containing protein [Nadsonia fulvescens var. elongata DSM 6958]|uniref:DnaJ-domain-containing protein n=1 Tax=Nadsonia fulvescens var. elongata DSM 6958 TaxID=857566 RepID=A0A1E3PKB5_9ASCO|nr:DnaJ-domain-containing protein [Nadsonia fulvescens var. elongata DSM 6958]